MGESYQAMMGEQKIVCPTCSHDRFHAKPHTISESLMQIFDWELFGKQGVMLICVNCGRVQQFARTDTIVLMDGSG